MSPMFHKDVAKANLKCGGCLTKQDVKKKRTGAMGTMIKKFLPHALKPLAPLLTTCIRSPMQKCRPALQKAITGSGAFANCGRLTALVAQVVSRAFPKIVIQNLLDSPTIADALSTMDTLYHPGRFYQKQCSTVSNVVDARGAMPEYTFVYHSKPGIICSGNSAHKCIRHPMTGPPQCDKALQQRPETDALTAYVIRAPWLYILEGFQYKYGAAEVYFKHSYPDPKSYFVRYIECIHAATEALDKAMQQGNADATPKFEADRNTCLKDYSFKKIFDPAKPMPSGRVRDTCATQVQVRLSRCTTCCCKGGLTSSSVSNRLVAGSSISCGLFFSVTDALVRVVVSLFRTGVIASFYSAPCFTKPPQTDSV